MSDQKAFPQTAVDAVCRQKEGSEGMDLRDYFAIRIFQSMLTNKKEISMNDTDAKSLIGLKESKTAYALADAMMEARES